MKNLFAIFAGVMLVCVATAQSPVALRFNKNSELKIVQFTDLHVVDNDKRSDVVFECFKNVMAAERPDFVIITGDLIYSRPADAPLRKIISTINAYGIPFTVTFGNHDRQLGMTNAQLFDILKGYPNFIGTTTKGISGVGNCDIVVTSSDGSKPAAIVYCIDSHENSEVPDIKGYNHIHQDQIGWYASHAAAHTAANGGEPLPALAFFHIPLPEYMDAASDPTAQLYGVRREKVCCPELNSGLFTAFKEQGDVMGIFVGHDHDNDFAAIHKGILLAYGRFSGGNTEYNNLANGARIIVMKEGKRSFDSWIRLRTGEVEQRTTFPDSWTKK